MYNYLEEYNMDIKKLEKEISWLEWKLMSKYKKLLYALEFSLKENCILHIYTDEHDFKLDFSTSKIDIIERNKNE